MPHGEYVLHVSFNPDGTRLLTACKDGTFCLWDTASGELLIELPPLSPPPPYHEEATCALFSPRGDRVLIALSTHHQSAGEALVCSASTGKALTPAIKFDLPVLDAAFSPDGGKFALVISHQHGKKRDNRVEVFDSVSGKLVRTITTGSTRLHAVEFGPHGQRVAVGSSRGEVRVWNVATGEPINLPMTHQGPISCVCFSPDGSRILTSGRDGMARIWDAWTGEPLTPPMRMERQIGIARYSPDGRWILTGTGTAPALPRHLAVNGQEFAQLWDAATGEAVSPRFRHGGKVLAGQFSPDGRRFATGCSNGYARIWEIDTDRRPLEDLTLLAQLISGSRIDANNAMIPLKATTFQAAWETLRAKYPQDFTASPAEELAWHRHQIRVCETHNDWSGASAHLDALLEAGSDRMVALPCNQCAWSLATSPDTSLRDPRRAVELAKKAVEHDPNEATYHNTLGVAQYRAGQWEAAIESLEKSLQLQGDNSFDFFFLAMGHWQLDRKDEARQWYNKAVEWMEDNGSDNEELTRFRAEAAELLEVTDGGQSEEEPESGQTQETRDRKSGTDGQKSSEAAPAESRPPPSVTPGP